VSLSRPVLLVGRHPDCDVRLDLPQISRRHCCLAMAYDRIVIRDLGSRHGVWVNGRQVQQAQLFPGDEIAIGHLLYRVEDTQSVPQPVLREMARPDPPRPVAGRAAAPDDSADALPGIPIDLGEISLRD
jgi:pSer/pThr/pTyr-binding forkhead associated (FHA) protein